LYIHSTVKAKWNSTKALFNLRDHGIDFADAAVALEDENALTIENKDHDEQRFKTLCLGPNMNVLLVVHAEQSPDFVRIISARKADRSETKAYFKGLHHE
jgi:uncharacterized DUF497 family protein